MPLHEPEAAARQASSVLHQFRNADWPVVHIRHESLGEQATFFLPGTLGVAIHPAVEPTGDEPVLTKHFPNSFRGTELHQLLQGMGVSRLVIVGSMTHMCIDATTRAARDLGYQNIVIGDACATRDLQYRGQVVPAVMVQTAFLAALNHTYAEVLTTKEWQAG